MTRYRLRGSKITKYKWRDNVYEVRRLRNTEDDELQMARYRLRDS